MENLEGLKTGIVAQPASFSLRALGFMSSMSQYGRGPSWIGVPFEG
jgi:hypothetical protein